MNAELAEFVKAAELVESAEDKGAAVVVFVEAVLSRFRDAVLRDDIYGHPDCEVPDAVVAAYASVPLKQAIRRCARITAWQTVLQVRDGMRAWVADLSGD